MFERFTEEARSVVVSAQDEACELGHGFVGTEHVLVGLAREGLAAELLAERGQTLDRLRELVREALAAA